MTQHRKRRRRDRGADVVGGWLLGHQIARGRNGYFPGDPLPGGHLGSPANLAFWGGALDAGDDADDTEEEDRDGDAADEEGRDDTYDGEDAYDGDDV